MDFSPIFRPTAERAPTQWGRDRQASYMLRIRDNFTLSTWLLIGATLHSLVWLVVPFKSLALIAAPIFLLLIQLFGTVLASFGVLKNTNMDGVIQGRTVPVFNHASDAITNHQHPNADNEVCCILLGARSNHPYGLFGPEYKEVGIYFARMINDLSDNATAHGFLGASSWLGMDRPSKNGILSVLYFNSLESLHAYAHGPLHTKATEWWVSRSKELPHVSLMHEIFAAPRARWEAVYLNHAPSGLGGTSVQILKGDEKAWINPLVKGNGKLRYSKGRMGVAFHEEHEWPEFEKAEAAY